MAVVTGTSGRDFIHSLGDGKLRPAGFTEVTGVTAGDDTISGLGGDDIIFAHSGNDSIDGGTGADEMHGGAGNDTYVVDNAGDTVVETDAHGTDLVKSSVSFGLAKQIEDLTLTGAANINATGNSLDNTILGNLGNNLIDGSTGADTMQGLGGNDTYVVDNAGDVVVEANITGTDLVKSSVSFSLAGQYIEKLTLTGTGNINATGNSLDNTILGNSGNNTLTGESGTDTFVFNTAPNASTNLDHVTDFASVDTIDLENAVFTTLTTTGTLAASGFFSAAGATSAHDADDRIVYNTTTGALYYDADGVGGVCLREFAILDNHAAITNADFVVV